MIVTVEYTEQVGKVAEIEVDEAAMRSAGWNPARPNDVHAWLETQRNIVVGNGGEGFNWPVAADAASPRPDGYVDDDPVLNAVILPGGGRSA